jgi:hypothetical protein
MVIVAVLGDRFEEGSVGVRSEDELGWSTHDGRLVAGKEGKLVEMEELRLENEVFLGPVPWSICTASDQLCYNIRHECKMRFFQSRSLCCRYHDVGNDA